MRYLPQKIEDKWRKWWLKDKTYEPDLKRAKKPYYNLMMFPYPSAEGLHIGGMRTFSGVDIYGRYKRMQGHDVFEPIGLDGFGIHSENYALKVGKHPFEHAKDSEKNFYRQLGMFGNGFAWEEKLETYDPDYYKWTQWIFIQMFKHGLAYRKKAAVNWCPSCKTVLADEQVISGECERCQSKVEKRDLEQWFFKITDYADRLLKNLDRIDWPEPIKTAQRNWIGKSEGAEIDFGVKTKNKPNFVLLHGYGGSPEKDFFPWLKKELEKCGYRVQMPVLPHSDKPMASEKNDMEALSQGVQINDNTVLLGHSLGAVVAMKALEQLDHPIRKLILVGGFLEPKFRDHDRAFKDTFNWVFNFEKIKENANSIIILHDRNDVAIPVDQGQKLFDALGGTLLEPAPVKSHFNGDQEPSVLPAVLDTVRVFTTRPDTLFGATYLVLGPEHPLIGSLPYENKKEVEEYIKKAKAKSDEERIAEGKEKTGVELKGVKAINPANGKEIPVWVADYVLGGVGTGAIMAVPAHDKRDWEFAKKFKLPIVPVVVESINCIVVHGCPSNKESLIDIRKDTKKHWIPWLRKELQKQGIAVSTPLMPDSWSAIYEEWKKEFEKLKITENSIIVGHSCGAAFIVRWLSENPRKIKKLILIAPAKILGETSKPTSKAFYDFDINTNLSRFVGEILIFVSDNEDERLKKSAALYAETLNTKIVWFKNKGHFMPDQMRTDHFPELLDSILSPLGQEVFLKSGTLINSNQFNRMESEKAKWEITKFVGGKVKTQYRLRDWLVSRQRYWGPPIPMIYCDKCGWQTVPEKDLPVRLPRIKNYRPTGTGIAPLASEPSFHKVKCPKCKSWAHRETDVSDTFLDSAWYYLRYPSVTDKKNPWTPSITKKWFPVDMYIGGAEHAVLHLLYVRFLAMAFYDWKMVHFEEPFKKFRTHGMIIKDGAKMSKSRGNVVNPDEYIKAYGSDAIRIYLAFLAPLTQGGDFRDEGIKGITRFLERIWNFSEKVQGKNSGREIQRAAHKAVKKVTEDIESFQYNTAISSLMMLLNEFEASPQVGKKEFGTFLKLLAPLAPHMSEELWYVLQGKPKKYKSIHRELWPKYDPKLIQEETFELIIQVNGKVRGRITMPTGASEAEARRAALAEASVKQHLPQEPQKVIFVPNKLINFVV